MERELVLKLGKRAKELMQEAETAAYSVTGISSVIRGTEILRTVQARIDKVVRKEKQWRHELWKQVDASQYFILAVIEENSIRLIESPELHKLLIDYAIIRSEGFCVLNDAAIEKRKSDKLMAWVDSLKEGGDESTNQIIRMLKRNFHSEVELAKFIYENAPK